MLDTITQAELVRSSSSYPSSLRLLWTVVLTASGVEARLRSLRGYIVKEAKVRVLSCFGCFDE